MWSAGETVVWRGIFRGMVWHAHSMIVVQDSPRELALALLPGAGAVTPEGYADGKRADKRRWFFKDRPWKLEEYTWHTNRLLALVEPEKYFATMLFWDGESGNFRCYYFNFQLPIRRGPLGVDTLDLDLDLVVHPDLTCEWKDIDDYNTGLATGVILDEWAEAVEAAKVEILGKVERREYPLDGTWLNWLPDPAWPPPRLPAGWDRV